MSALTSPTICFPLPSAITVDRYTYLCGFHLADECSRLRDEINILIGFNFYWSIVTGKIAKADKRPVSWGGFCQVHKSVFSL